VSLALLYANSERLVVEFLLDHPIDALELTSGAIFALNDSGTAFKRIAATNWEESTLTEIAIDDALVAQLRAVQQPLDLRRAAWHPDGLPPNDKAPTLAVQVLMRGEVFAIALYGRHVSGAEISGDEQELLHSVAANAAAAFDHLDAERTRREIEALRSENAALQKLSRA
jgi:GAF domain-containing protein